MKQLLKPIEPSEDFVPVLSLNRGLDEFVKKFHLLRQHGSDDLDDYDVVLLETESGRPFLLLEYKRAPAVDVYIPSRMLSRLTRIMEEIVKELRVSKSDVTILRQAG